MRRMNKNAGFSLVELIVVIAIMAVLAGVGVAGYSMYLDHADKAADEALLYEVNLAFNTACNINGVAPTDIQSAVWDMNTKKVTHVNGSPTDPIVASFDEFFEVTNATFRVYTYLKFEEGKFVAGDEALNSVLATLLGMSDSISDFKNSAFYKADGLGVEGLMGSVVDITDLAVSFMQGSNGVQTTLASGAYADALANALGFESATAEGYEAAVGALVMKKAEQLAIADGKTVSDYGEYMNAASQQILANNTILTAANLSSSANANTLISDIKGGFTGDDITAIKNNSDGEGISKAAAAYALYTAYAYSLPEGEREDAITATGDISAMLQGIQEDEGFQQYLETEAATTDLNGYLASMGMINGCVGSEATENILLNGFGDSDLLALLQQATSGN